MPHLAGRMTRAAGVSRGEEAELAVRCCPEEWVHPGSLDGLGCPVRASDEVVDDAA